MQKSNHLLPNSVNLVNYDLRLWLDFDNFTFDGRVLIDINICEPVREITLHAVELEIDASNVEVWCHGRGTAIVSQEVRFDERAQTATFVFAEELPVDGEAWALQVPSLSLAL